jgi:hypothetical protein
LFKSIRISLKITFSFIKTKGKWSNNQCCEALPINDWAPPFRGDKKSPPKSIDTYCIDIFIGKYIYFILFFSFFFFFLCMIGTTINEDIIKITPFLLYCCIFQRAATAAIMRNEFIHLYIVWDYSISSHSHVSSSSASI